MPRSRKDLLRGLRKPLGRDDPPLTVPDKVGEGVDVAAALGPGYFARAWYPRCCKTVYFELHLAISYTKILYYTLFSIFWQHFLNFFRYFLVFCSFCNM